MSLRVTTFVVSRIIVYRCLLLQITERIYQCRNNSECSSPTQMYCHFVYFVHLPIRCSLNTHTDHNGVVWWSHNCELTKYVKIIGPRISILSILYPRPSRKPCPRELSPHSTCRLQVNTPQ